MFNRSFDQTAGQFWQQRRKNDTGRLIDLERARNIVPLY